MKHLIIAVLTSLPIYLCSQSNIDASNAATLSGTIENHDRTVLKIYDLLGKASWEDVIAIKDNGFSKNIALNNPAIKMLKYGNLRKDVFFHPGKSLEVSFDAENIENTFRYGGDLKTENYLMDSISGRLDNIDYSYLYAQPLDLTTRYLDSIKNDCEEYLESLLHNYKVTTIFEAYANASFDYFIASLKIMLGEDHDEPYMGYYDFLKELNFKDPKLLDIPNYRMFLYYYIQKETNERYTTLDSIQKQVPDAKFYETLKVIDHLKNDDIRAYSLYTAMIDRLNEYGVNEFDRHYKYFEMHNIDSKYAEQMRLAYEEKKRIAPGQQAPSFTLVDIDGNQVSLQDFQGKYVYIDFWLTTCPRSARELPDFLKLYADYKSDNIAFVSISPDQDKNAWINYVKEKRNVGTCLWSDNFIDSEVFTEYQVYGTPTYILIDTDGKIIDPVAPKPSSKEIRIIFDKLLKKK